VIVRFGALRITTLTTVIGAVGLWLVVGLAWGAWVDPRTLLARDAGQVVALLTIAFWNTTLTQWLWLGGLAAVPDVTRGIYLFFLKPVIAAGLALFILGQPVTGLQWLAILVICGAVVLEASWTRLFGRTSMPVRAG
jgi:drug/metabolite transporter (DMT)-like permease